MCRVQPCLPPSSEVALQQKSVELYATLSLKVVGKPENTIMDNSPRHKRRSIMRSCSLNENFLRSQ